MEYNLQTSQTGAGSSKLSWLKYLVLEVGVVVLLVIVVGLILFNPLKNLKFSATVATAKEMTQSINSKGEKVYTTPSKFAPVIVSFTINDGEIVPAEQVGSVNGTIITIINNSINPQTVKFTGNLLPEVKIAPNFTWQSGSLTTKGTFEISVESTESKGQITLK